MALSEQIIFGALAVIVLGSALMVVTMRNILHCAIFLVFTFMGVAGLYILLNAEFMAAAQIFVYIGAISVLIIFGVMLTHQLTRKGMRIYNGPWQLTLSVVIVGVLLFTTLAPAITEAWGPSRVVPAAPLENTTSIVGNQLLTTYLLPFELASLLLLVAMVGAIVMAMLSDRPQPLTRETSAFTEKPVETPAAGAETAAMSDLEPEEKVEEKVS